MIQPDDTPPDLIVTKAGNAVANEENVFTILEHHEEMQAIRYDDLSQKIVLTRELHTDRATPGRYPRHWEDRDDHFLAAWMQRTYSCNVSALLVRACIDALARNRKYHPVRHYLSTLSWDGTQRIDNWLCDYLGADDTDYVRAVAAAFLVGAVARAMKPGCKMDTMLVLEGPQGIGKSKALGALVPDEQLFTDALDLSGDHRQMAEQLQGKWLVECAELGGLNKGEVEKVKAFLSRQVDHYRPPYGRTAVDHPRQCVLTGSTNVDGYLRDETGGRRFWPVRTGVLRTDRLSAERDQLWAEARATYEAGAHWWLSENIETSAKVEQAERLAVDPWDEVILEFADGREKFSTADVLAGPLSKPKGQWGKADEMRVSSTLRRAGYVNKASRDNGILKRKWTK